MTLDMDVGPVWHRSLHEFDWSTFWKLAEGVEVVYRCPKDTTLRRKLAKF